MKITKIGIVASCVLAQQAAATFDWGNAKTFSNPSNTNNECTPEQQAGFDWSDLAVGAFEAYKGFDFSGFACSTSDGNSSLKTRAGSQGKLIEGKVSKNAEAAPKIACPDKGFSITDMEISTSLDTDVEFVYDMPDGSACKHTESCSASGSNVKNTQCGGAVSVSFRIPEQGGEVDCDLGIHSVGFDCLPASASPSSEPASETSPIVAQSTSAVGTASDVESTSSSSGQPTLESSPVPESAILADAETSSVEAPPSNTSLPIESPAVPPTAPAGTDVPPTTSTIFSTFTSTEVVCGSDVPDCPASSIKIVTMTTAVLTTIAPAIETIQPPAEIETTSDQPTPTSGPEATPSSEPETAKEGDSAPTPADVVTTEMVFTTLTTCPVTITSASGSETITSTTMTVSQTVITSISTLCTQCTEAPPTTLTAAQTATTPAASQAAEDATPAPPTSVAPEASSPTAEVPEGESQAAAPPSDAPPSDAPPSDAPCPPVLPSCLNSWLSLLPECTSNSDASCFCPSKEFTDAIIGCVQAWGASTDEMSAALSYFTGICAADIPQNLAIITDVPSTITLGPMASPVSAEVATAPIPSASGEAAIPSADATSPAAAPFPEVPVTVISYTQTIAPTPAPAAGNGQQDAAGGGEFSEPGVVTTYVTVPQVSFITTSVAETPIAGKQSAGAVAPQAVTTGVGLVPAAVTTTPPPPSGIDSASAPPSGANNGTISSNTSSGPALFTGAAFHIGANGMGAGAAAAAAVVAAIFV